MEILAESEGHTFACDTQHSLSCYLRHFRVPAPVPCYSHFPGPWVRSVPPARLARLDARQPESASSSRATHFLARLCGTPRPSALTQASRTPLCSLLSV